MAAGASAVGPRGVLFTAGEFGCAAFEPQAAPPPDWQALAEARGAALREILNRFRAPHPNYTDDAWRLTATREDVRRWYEAQGIDMSSAWPATRRASDLEVK